MGGFIRSVVRKIAKSEDPIKEVKKIMPHGVTTTKPKVEPKSAVGAGDDAGEDTKASMVRRRRRAPTRTAMTSPRGDQSTANVSRKTLLGA